MAINLIRIWYFVCLIFLLVNLNNLIYDSLSVKYIEKEFKKHELTFHFWICIKFNEIKLKSEGSFPKSFEPNSQVTVGEILNETISHLNKKSTKFKFSLNETHLFNRQFCFSVQNEDLKDNLSDYLSAYDIRFYGFSYDILPMYYKSIYFKKAGESEIADLKNHQQKIMNCKKPNAYQECVINKQNNQDNNFNCLKNCFKNSTSLDVYYDFSDYSKKVDLKAIFDKNYENSSNTFKEFCLEKCKHEVCFWETSNTITLNPGSNSLEKVENYQLLIETTPILLEFWINFFGLVTLFTSTSLVQSLPILLKYLSKVANKEEFLRRYLLYIRFALIVFSLIYLISKGISLIDDHNQSLKEPSKTINLNFSLEPSNYSIVICIPIQYLILNANKLSENNDKIILKEKTFGEIENLTNNGLDKVVDNIYLKYGDEKRIQNYKVSKKVIFKNSSTFRQDDRLINHLQRCFYISPNVRVPRYESMMAIANLLIAFKNELYELFVTDPNQDLSSSDLSYQVDQFKITKFFRIFNSNCSDYFSGGISTSQQKAIERCFSKLYFSKYSKVSTSTGVIVKDDFRNSENEYDKIKLNASTNEIDRSYFGTEFDSEIQVKCQMMFEKRSCKMIKFNSSFKKGTSKEFKLEKEIELYHEKETEAEISSTFMSTFLTIVNLESILFGTNIPGTMMILFSILRSFFKVNWHPMYRYLIFFTCTLGFFVHIFLIFHEIIIETLIDAGEYERKDGDLEVPALVFCFPFNVNELDENHLITGEYLNRFTSNLTFDKIFDKILYYNKSKFVNLNLIFNDNEMVYEIDEVKLDYFYFNSFKCFKIKNKIRYDEKDFFFKKDVYSVKLFLNRKFKTEDFYFFYMNKRSRQLIEIYSFNLTNYKYKVKLELFEIEIIDKFELLKNPLRLLFKENNINDGSLYLSMMTNDFKNSFNLSSLSVPLLPEQFQLEINNRLFHQFYLQIQDPVDRQYPSSVNSKRLMYNCYEQQFSVLTDEPDIAFGIDFQARIVKVTNELNFGKLLQNILNSLSLWYNICILDLYNSFIQIGYLFKHVYRLLIYLKNLTEPDY